MTGDASANPAEDALLDTSLLEQPPRLAVRRIALGVLDAAALAYPRLADDRDTEALHDFRVALRRLRSAIRAYAPLFEDTLSERLTRRLRDLARLTGPSRDLEVQQIWLARAAASMETGERPGADFVTGRVARARSRADRRMLRQLARRWPALHSELSVALERYTADVPGRRSSIAPFAATVSAQARRLADRMAKRLAGVEDVVHDEAAHDARIAGKRLRYLLEPVAAEIPSGAAAIRELKELQDALGDLHDAHVLEEQLREYAESEADGSDEDDRQPGLNRLAELARVARDESFDAARRWLGSGAGHAGEALGAAIGELAAAGRRGIEVERKYLLTACPPVAAASPTREIVQGYLPGGALIERIRRTTDPEGNVRHTRTVKSGRGIARLEIEEACDAALFDALWPLTAGRRVEKRRNVVEDGAVSWEVDVFMDRDLVLAEVELGAPDAAVLLPEWLSAYVVREVTDEAAFVNANLAR